jgi:hypothetical protein
MREPDPEGSRSLLRSLLALAWVVEARDPYTGGHSWRVSQFAMLLAERAGLPRREIARIGVGGFLHDLGKIGVPDAVLNKPGKLTDEEYAVIKTHPDIGAGLLAAHPLGSMARAAVHLHHETPDGKGYPHGYALDLIPTEARIIGLVDAFDAMTSTRPYRKGMPTEKALAIVSENLGAQFDRAFGESLIAVGRDGGLAHIIGHTEPGIPLQPCVECGPTIVVNRSHKDGETLFCRACGGGVVLHRDGGRIEVEDRDIHGTPAELADRIDEALLEELLGGRFGDALRTAA